ncbi:hypothetical protein ACEQPO_14730 [Bacillus sp. SL00103]
MKSTTQSELLKKASLPFNQIFHWTTFWLLGQHEYVRELKLPHHISLLILRKKRLVSGSG